MRLMNLLSILAVATLMQTRAFAGAPAVKHEAKPLAPADRYSGATPIEIKNGLLFNNGTFGAPNNDYEKWAQGGLLVPGLADQNYPYAKKAEFVRGLQESANFVADAISNWKEVTPNTKPEAKEYSEQSIQAMEPVLKKFNDSIKTAAGSSQSDWDKNQDEAKDALAELRGTYSSLHKNVR